ncbi:MAG TPA: BON domain-containing protein [Vicinamibacterales bacterium]|nr:BON domain-containing protein [Vicinamibacterales bacterium]
MTNSTTPTRIAAIEMIWGTERATVVKAGPKAGLYDREELRFVLVVEIDVVLRACRDIVDVDRAVVVEVVDGVDASAAAFLDRAARLVFLVLSALLAAQALGRRRRAEIRAAVAAAGTHRPAGAWTSEAAASRTRTAETAAGPRAAESTASAARARNVPLAGRARRTIFTRPRFADREVAPLERLRVEALDDLFGLSAIRELHEGKPARTPGFAIDRHHYVGGLGDSRKVGAKVRFAGPVGKVPDEQTDSQGFLVSVGGSDSIPELEPRRYTPRTRLARRPAGKVEEMNKPRVFTAMVALVLAAAVACNRGQANRETERAAEQVKAAAEQAGEKLADSWLTTKIQAQFFADDDIKSRFINVASRDGTVTLKGFVESDDARRQVLEITRNTDGVKQIDDSRLLVGRPASESFETVPAPAPAPVATTGVAQVPPATDDATVTSFIQAKYFLDPAIKVRHIEVQVAGGVVTLKGQVASESERAQALLLARSAPGVTRVEDYLSVDAAIQ